MSTKLLEIPAALDGRLATMVGLPSVAWSNIDFDPDADELYLRPRVVVGRNTPIGIADSDTSHHVGMYQVDVFAPKNQGAKPGNDLAQKVADHFPKGLVLTTTAGKIKIANAYMESSGNNAGSHYQTVLLINYTTIVS